MPLKEALKREALLFCIRKKHKAAKRLAFFEGNLVESN